MNQIELLDLLTELQVKLENLNLMIDQQASKIYVPEQGRTPIVIMNDLMKEQVVNALEDVAFLKKEIQS